MKCKKQFFSTILIVALVITMMPVVTLEAFAATSTYFDGGTGTQSDPYLISTANQFDKIRNYPDAHYKLTEDISLASYQYYGWEPIPSFSGSLDGDGHKITDFKLNKSWAGSRVDGVTQTSASYGLFSTMSGHITDLHLDNVNVQVTVSSGYSSSQSVSVGALVGNLSGTIENCSVSGKVTVTSGSDMTSATLGALVGGGSVMIGNGMIRNCENTADVTGNMTRGENANVGGIAGSFGGEISNCVNKGHVYSDSRSDSLTGGIAGSIGRFSFDGESQPVSNCTNYGLVEATTSSTNSPNAFAGGIIGKVNYKSTVTGCENYGEVSAAGYDSYAAGVVCLVMNGNDTRIEKCYNMATVGAYDINSVQYGSHEAAGISCGDGIINQCFNSGQIKAYGNDTIKAAGIVICTFKSVTDCFNTGKIEADTTGSYSVTGGIICSAPCPVTDCYNIGEISGGEVGGIACSLYNGSSAVTPSISDCYYLNNCTKGVCNADTGYTCSVTSCTDTAMKTKSTFSGFDFANVWTMGSGTFPYPVLKSIGYVSGDMEEVCKRLGHKLQPYEAKAATCTEFGWDAYEACSVCDYTTYEVIPATGHIFDGWITQKEATCVTDGYEAVACAGCGYIEYVTEYCDPAVYPYPESPHNYGNDKSYEYTYTYPGAISLLVTFSYNTMTESGCDYIRIYDENNKLYGRFSGGSLQGKTVTVSGDTVRITLSTDEDTREYGFSIIRIEAGVCDGNTARVIPATGVHTPIIAAGDEAVDPTCTEPGKTAKYTCKHCGITVTDSEPVSELGHEGNDDGDCATAVMCERCTTHEITPAETEHNFSADWYFDGEEGHWHKCLNDGCSKGDATVPHVYENSADTTCDCGYMRTIQTVTVSGTITSFGTATDNVTVELWEDGADAASYTVATTGSTAVYTMENVAVGTYTMKVMKNAHVPREYTITVGSSDVTQDVKIHLKGDVNMDGNVDIGDHQRLFTHLQRIPEYIISDEYQLAIANVNEDAAVDIGDHQRLFTHLQRIYPLF